MCYFFEMKEKTTKILAILNYFTDNFFNKHKVHFTVPCLFIYLFIYLFFGLLHEDNFTFHFIFSTLHFLSSPKSFVYMTSGILDADEIKTTLHF